MPLKIYVEVEEDKRWIADLPELPGVMAYGTTRSEAIHRAEVIALDVLREKFAVRESTHLEDVLFVVKDKK